ncbi:MAG: GNAT family N-acetyltransferase [Streptosporangiaceae bacterium]
MESLGYRTDLMMRQLEGSTVTDAGGYLVVASPAHPDFWWGNFLLLPASALGDEAAVWLARFAEAFPKAGHVALGIDATTATGAPPARFLAAGLRPDLNTVLTATALREPPHPNRAAQCRRLDGDDDWRHALDLRMACSDAGGLPGGPEFETRRVQQARRLTEAGYGACFGAFQAGRLVAQLGVFCDGSGTARYQNVETHPTARRQGLAGTLVCRAGQYALAELGASLLVIVADPGYPAIRIYRSAGFADQETQLGLEREPPAR